MTEHQRGPVLHQPVRPARREITARTVMLSVALAILLAAANAYLGLKVGMTVSASIPAAVIAMATLRLFRERSILESNIVQTAASAGEALAAGVIFTLPALVLMGYWAQFRYAETAVIGALGGVLGVLFAVPLRRVLLGHAELSFPEGVATATVLKVGEAAEGRVRLIVSAGLAAAVLKFLQTGLQAVAGSVAGGFTAGKAVIAFGSELSVALLGVGYIVGPNIAFLVFAGGAFAWLVAIPAYTVWAGLPLGADGVPLVGLEAAFQIWSTKIRYIGVGAMLVGGVWALLAVLQPLRAGMRATRLAHSGPGHVLPPSERDLSLRVVIPGTLALAVPLFLTYRLVIDAAALQASPGVYWAVVAGSVLFALLAGFVFSAVAGYMSGLVGSSNNPVSGVTIATVLSSSLLLATVLGAGLGSTVAVDGERAAAAAAVAVLVGAVVCCAAAISGDTMQDLKSGRLLGATPYKQQVMQLVGVLAAALTLAPVLSLLYNAYGLGGSFPRPGMDPAQTLAAPQATLMQAVAMGVFSRQLEWGMVSIGAVIAALVILLDWQLRRRQAAFRTPVLAVAVGIYLPVQLAAAIFVGGVTAHLAHRRHGRTAPRDQNGVLFASGLVAGEAIAGILLAIPFALAQRTDPLRVLPEGLESVSQLLGVALFAAFALWLFRVGRR